MQVKPRQQYYMIAWEFRFHDHTPFSLRQTLQIIMYSIVFNYWTRFIWGEERSKKGMKNRKTELKKKRKLPVSVVNIRFDMISDLTQNCWDQKHMF